jgi:hypothetical protein
MIHSDIHQLSHEEENFALQKKVHIHGCTWTQQTKTKTYKIYITIISLELINKLTHILEICKSDKQI